MRKRFVVTMDEVETILMALESACRAPQRERYTEQTRHDMRLMRARALAMFEEFVTEAAVAAGYVPGEKEVA